MLSFGLRVDLIVNDKAGSVWLVNFGCPLIKLGGGKECWTETCKHSVILNQTQNV